MAIHWDQAEQARTTRYLVKWTALSASVGILGGSASAVFLVSLDYATAERLAHPWLLYLLPLGGCLIGLFYQHFGKGCEGGNNLVLEEIHKPTAGVSGRLAPVILLATVATHLFGGSAGREGTAVQMGGGLAGLLARRLGLDRLDTRILLMAGISAGFGSVFGTPLAGMMFGLEVLAVGRVRFEGLVPCLVASYVGDWTCTLWGVHHTHYLVHEVPALSGWLVLAVLLASCLFGLVSLVFAELTAGLHWLFARLIRWGPGRAILGGFIIIGLVEWLGTRDYLGLGIPMIVQSFQPGGVPTWAFAWKVLFTAVTLSCGFKGGEVTPLFFIGATLGCTLGTVLGVAPAFLAALGFVAVFSGAANTPLACTMMGIELFGAPYGGYLATACCFSYIWSGHRGIYLAQVIDTPKADERHFPVGITLAKARSTRPAPAFQPGLLARLVGGASALPSLTSPGSNGELNMGDSGASKKRRIGIVRIYLSAGDRLPGLTWKQRLVARPLYEEIIDRARVAGLWAATAHGMVHGFSYAGEATATFHPDAGWVNTHIYVELIAPGEQLELFMQQVKPLLANRAVTYSESEDWSRAVEAPRPLPVPAS
jgi:H+/Cl- antiporter ClcA/PII-like signaling protein